MLRKLIVTSLAAALAASAGCYSEADVSAQPGYGYGAADPDLEYVSPGVQVVDDMDYPVFFSDGFYWRNDGGYWYQSRDWRGGWIGVGGGYVPFGIRGILNPGGYAHWHGGYARGGIAYRGGVGRGGIGRGPVVTGRTYARPGNAHVVARSSGGHSSGGHGGGHGGGHR
jgi:hypothetical protein